MFLEETHLGLVHVEHRAAHPALVGVDFDHLLSAEPGDAGENRDRRHLLHELQQVHQSVGCFGHRHPVAVHKDADRRRHFARGHFAEHFRQLGLLEQGHKGGPRIAGGDLGGDRHMLVEPHIPAVGGVERVDDPPLRAVEQPRTDHLGAGVHGEVDLAALRERRVERKPIQVLDHPRSLGVGLGAPVSLERLAEPGFHIAVFEIL